MTSTQWAEFAGLGFAMAVLAWAVFRLTGVLAGIFDRLFSDSSTPPKIESDEGEDR